jgi:hypothetical protein
MRTKINRGGESSCTPPAGNPAGEHAQPAADHMTAQRTSEPPKAVPVVDTVLEVCRASSGADADVPPKRVGYIPVMATDMMVRLCRMAVKHGLGRYMIFSCYGRRHETKKYAYAWSMDITQADIDMFLNNYSKRPASSEGDHFIEKMIEELTTLPDMPAWIDLAGTELSVPLARAILETTTFVAALEVIRPHVTRAKFKLMLALLKSNLPAQRWLTECFARLRFMFAVVVPTFGEDCGDIEWSLS